MTQDTSIYYVWIGGSCDYAHKERAGSAAVVIELIKQQEQSQKCLNSAESRQKKTKDQHHGVPHDANPYDQSNAGNPGRFQHSLPNQCCLYSKF